MPDTKWLAIKRVILVRMVMTLIGLCICISSMIRFTIWAEPEFVSVYDIKLHYNDI